MAASADAAALTALSEAFPGLPLSRVKAVLRESHGNLNTAATALLQNQDRAGGSKGKRHNTSWGTLAEAPGQRQPQPMAPRFKSPSAHHQPGSNEVLLTSSDFPQGPLTAGSSSAVHHLLPETPAAHGQAWGAGPAAQRQQPQGNQQQPQWYRQQQPPQQQQQQSWHPQPQQPQQQGQQGQRREAVGSSKQRLLAEHAWAGWELVAAVLAACQGDAGAAAAALADMVAEDSPVPNAPHVPASGSTGMADPAEQPGSLLVGSQAPASDAAAANGSRSRSRGSGLSSGGTAWDGYLPGAEEEEAGEPSDPYYRYRRQALQLSRRWQQAARGAGAAFAAGQHSTARQLAGQAQRLRRDALTAHAGAAERIELENNQDKSLFDIDLHGLHADEAVAALDRRLELLHSLLADPATSAAASASGAPAGRQRLRVVVGRGAHSSGGEATVPRVVESHLRAAGLRFSQRGGAVDVQLRGAAGLAASAASTGVAAGGGLWAASR